MGLRVRKQCFGLDKYIYNPILETTLNQWELINLYNPNITNAL